MLIKSRSATSIWMTPECAKELAERLMFVSVQEDVKEARIDAVVENGEQSVELHIWKYSDNKWETFESWYIGGDWKFYEPNLMTPRRVDTP